jgi:hypothetical protein
VIVKKTKKLDSRLFTKAIILVSYSWIKSPLHLSITITRKLNLTHYHVSLFHVPHKRRSDSSVAFKISLSKEQELSPSWKGFEFYIGEVIISESSHKSRALHKPTIFLIAIFTSLLWPTGIGVDKVYNWV